MVLTALDDGCGCASTRRGGGERLLEKRLARDERYVLPADASDPRINTGRPDALAITVGGKSVPPLADTPVTISRVPVSAAALLARSAPTPTPTPDPQQRHRHRPASPVPAVRESPIPPLSLTRAATVPVRRQAAAAASVVRPAPRQTGEPVPDAAPDAAPASASETPPVVASNEDDPAD